MKCGPRRARVVKCGAAKAALSTFLPASASEHISVENARRPPGARQRAAPCIRPGATRTPLGQHSECPQNTLPALASRTLHSQGQPRAMSCADHDDVE